MAEYGAHERQNVYMELAFQALDSELASGLTADHTPWKSPLLRMCQAQAFMPLKLGEIFRVPAVAVKLEGLCSDIFVPVSV